MNNKILKTEIGGAIFLILMGSFMHFAYSNFFHFDLMRFFAPINESIWEHMKLAYVPLVLFSFFEFWFLKFKNKSNFFFIKTLEMYIIVFTTAFLFYTYSGIIGFNLLFADILVYVLAVITGQYISYKKLINLKDNKLQLGVACILALILLFAFTYFTLYPPSIPLFISKS